MDAAAKKKAAKAPAAAETPALAEKPATDLATPIIEELTAALPPSVRPVDNGRINELIRLRQASLDAGNITDDQAKKAFWTNTLAPYNVTSATKLTVAQADELIGKLAEPLQTPAEKSVF